MISYLQVENLSKSFGERQIFSDISFAVSKGDRVAMVAPNGAGKTTLFKIIVGRETSDSGKISFRNDIRISYLPQDPELDPEHTVFDEIFQSDTPKIQIIKVYEKALQEHHQAKLEKALEAMNAADAWAEEARLKMILGMLGFTDFEQKVSHLSGGQQKRLALAKILAEEPDLLILDEPTNHLQVEMIEWLEEYLAKQNITLLMVTHDRYFLNRVCDQIIELHNNQIYRYQGNYEYFVEARNERLEQQQSQINKAINLLRYEQDWMNRMPQARATKAKFRKDNYYKLKEQASQRIDNKKLDLSISGQRTGNKIIEIKHLTKSFGDLKIITDFSYIFSRGEKIGVVGPNGVGKTTFLRLILGESLADKGVVEIGQTIKIGYFKQDIIHLDPQKRMIEVVKEISERIIMADGRELSPLQFLEHFLFPSSQHYALVEKLSGGERRRLALLTVLMQNPNFLILDEPTNDLDIMTLNVLEEFLVQFQGGLIIVSHDRYFMDKIVDHLFIFKGDGEIKDFPGNYSWWREQEKEIKEAELANAKTVVKEKDVPKNSGGKKLTYSERIELENLEKEISTLEKTKTLLMKDLENSTLSVEMIQEKANAFSTISGEIELKEMRWLELHEKYE
jgi:ATP-binding cassette subfamily F protein uup